MSAPEWVAGAQNDLTVVEAPDLSVLSPLPHGHVPCRDCGIAVPLFAVDVGSTANSVALGKCRVCSARTERAAARAEEHPTLAKRYGTEGARVRVESVLIALEILGATPGEGHRRLDLLLWRLCDLGDDARFARWIRLARGRCAPQPWAHLDSARINNLRAGHAGALADWLADSMPRRDLHCPSGGCLHCGRSSFPLPELGVSRRGGVRLATVRVWRAVSATPAALGMKGARLLQGHLCPDCDAAVREVGAIGPSSRRRAFLDHAKATYDDRTCRRLQKALADVDGLRVPAWISLGRGATRTPWFHQRNLIKLD